MQEARLDPMLSGIAVGIGRASSEIRNVSDRYYYRSIQRISLISWKRKLKQWYVVSIIDKNNRRKHILRTQTLDDAKLLTDAMTTIVNVYGKMKVNDNGSKSKGASH